MLLQNFDHHITALMANAYQTATNMNVTAAAAAASVKNTSGGVTSSIPAGSTSSGSGGAYAPISLSEKSICIGDGDTPVNYGDFRLAGSTIGSTFTLVSNTLGFDEDSHCFVRTLVAKYTNTNNNDFVVKEWGIWRPGQASITFSNNSNAVYLVYREVLDEPITIAGNSTATLTFTLKIPHEMNAF